MGDHITGIKTVHEISLTRKAANQHCTKVLLKNIGAGQAQIIHGDPAEDKPAPEESEMDYKIVKALAGLTAVGQAYVAGLEEDKIKSFFEQDATAQAAEVQAHVDAEKVKSDAALEADKVKNAKDPVVAALEDKVKSLEATATADKVKAREVEIEKSAALHYPLVPNAKEVLKSIDALPEAAQKPVLDSLAAQQTFAKKFAKSFGDDEALPGSATQKHEALVEEVAKTKSITKSAAVLDVAQDPKHAGLIAEMRAEMAG